MRATATTHAGTAGAGAARVISKPPPSQRVALVGGNPLEGLPRLRAALEEIRNERVRGAAWAAYRAARGLLEELEEGRDPCVDPGAVATAVEAANPTMASLANVALILRLACERGAAEEALRRLVGYLSRGRERLAEAARSVEAPRYVVTLSYSSSVEAVLRAWREQKPHVVVAESRPGGEGVELARRLRSAGVRVTLTPDLAAHLHLGPEAALVFGADTVGRDGCIVNKVGTRLLATAARAAGAATLAVFEPYKVHPSRGCGEIPIERWTIEVRGWGSTSVPVFDETPAGLVDAALTPEGLRPWAERGAGEAARLHESFLGEVLP
jgi:translation initiation factor 2B subunit (eIF-2B alpha/beta/delta family)